MKETALFHGICFVVVGCNADLIISVASFYPSLYQFFHVISFLPISQFLDIVKVYISWQGNYTTV